VNDVVNERDACDVLNSVKGPELLNMYVGQSEENVREGDREFTYLTPDVKYLITHLVSA